MTAGGAEVREKKAKIWERDEHDFYVEERRASQALFAAERFVGRVWDPACGSGQIIKSAAEAGYSTLASDIVCRSPEVVVSDFINSDFGADVPNIVTNPPFFRGRGTEAFIRKALSIADGKVAIFASIKFLAGAQRANGLFAEHCPHRIWIITPRVSCPPGEWLAAGNKAGGGTDDWCWLVWSLCDPKPLYPQLGWLRKDAA